MPSLGVYLKSNPIMETIWDLGHSPLHRAGSCWVWCSARSASLCGRGRSCDTLLSASRCRDSKEGAVPNHCAKRPNLAPHHMHLFCRIYGWRLICVHILSQDAFVKAQKSTQLQASAARLTLRSHAPSAEVCMRAELDVCKQIGKVSSIFFSHPCQR